MKDRFRSVSGGNFVMFIHVFVTDSNDAWASGGVSAPFGKGSERRKRTKKEDLFLGPHNQACICLNGVYF